jgi:hypothetical protein
MITKLTREVTIKTFVSDLIVHDDLNPGPVPIQSLVVNSDRAPSLLALLLTSAGDSFAAPRR